MVKILQRRVRLPNGETMAYREREGGEELILLVHGNMSSSQHWDLLMEEMADSYKLYAVDLRGFGDSSYKTPINSLQDLSEDLHLFVQALGLKNLILLGWSTGGGVVMQFAADYPQLVKGLILLESVGTRGYPIFKKDEKGQAIVGEFLTTKEEIAQDPVQVLPVLNAYQNRDKETLRTIWNQLIYTHKEPEPKRYDVYLEEMLKQRNLVDIDYALVHFNISGEFNGIREGSGAAARIKAPVLVLWGKNDLVVPEKMALDITNDIGENAQLVYLEGCGHSPLTDDLGQLIRQIESFVTSL